MAINDNPGKTANEIAMIFNKKKLYSQIRFLCKKGYLKAEGYPMKLYITEKGLNEIREVVM
ncbi:MAG TPA: hypothetical protein VJB11_03535 [archaeon]|nr:hypothetical protein [archaeon]